MTSLLVIIAFCVLFIPHGYAASTANFVALIYCLIILAVNLYLKPKEDPNIVNNQLGELVTELTEEIRKKDVYIEALRRSIETKGTWKNEDG